MRIEKIGNITFILGDCMEFLEGQKDNAFDLAIIDPPYGIGEKLTTGGGWAKKYTKEDSRWDIKPPIEYFDLIKKVSNNYIIWGGNYFSEYIAGARCFLVWRKLQMLGMHTMADCELALTSFDKNAKIFNSGNSRDRIHPTQKPVKLYKWQLQQFATPGDKILDTHGGSGSIAIACYKLGFELTIIEKREEYFNAMLKRFKLETAQKQLF